MLFKQAISYALILTFAVNLFAEAGIYFSFKINQDYIAKFLCVEKDKPDSTCHGCCQLKNRLEEHEEKKQELPQSETKKNDIQLFVNHPSSLIPYEQGLEKMNFPIFNHPGILLSDPFFRPPRC